MKERKLKVSAPEIAALRYLLEQAEKKEPTSKLAQEKRYDEIQVRAIAGRFLEKAYTLDIMQTNDEDTLLREIMAYVKKHLLDRTYAGITFKARSPLDRVKERESRENQGKPGILGPERTRGRGPRGSAERERKEGETDS